MMKRLMFLILSLAVLVGMGLATSAAIAGDGMYGQMRFRWEGLKNFDDWSSDNADNFGFTLVRSRLGYSTEIGERGMFNLAMQNTRVMGFDGYLGYVDGPSKANTWLLEPNLVLVHEAYLGISDLFFTGFDAYAGRFSLNYGRERIIGAEDWNMMAEHRFDGFKGHYAFDKGWFDLLCLKLNETFMQKYEDYGDAGDFDLRGVYGHIDAAEGMFIEPYILYATQDNWNDPEEGEYDFEIKNDSYFAFGALFDYMSDMGLHFYAEGTMVSGTMRDWDGPEDDMDVSTLGFYAGAFYEFESSLKPFIGAEINYASGTKNDDEKMKTFFSPFGSNSSYMGVMDMVDWANTFSLRFAGGLTPVEGTDVKLDFYLFKLATDEDHAYGEHFYHMFDSNPFSSGLESLLPAGIWGADANDDGIYDSKNVGTEIDFFVNHKIEDGVTIEGGVSMFSFGDYFGANNEYDSLLFGWLGGQVEF